MNFLQNLISFFRRIGVGGNAFFLLCYGAGDILARLFKVRNPRRKHLSELIHRQSVEQTRLIAASGVDATRLIQEISKVVFDQVTTAGLFTREEHTGLMVIAAWHHIQSQGCTEIPSIVDHARRTVQHLESSRFSSAAVERFLNTVKKNRPPSKIDQCASTS